MTELQIVRQASKKAIKQGWDGKGYMFNAINPKGHSYYTTLGYPLKHAKKILVNHKNAELEIELQGVDIYRLIFSHDFARALWSEKDYGLTDMGKWEIGNTWNIYTLVLPEWKMRLQQMVLKENPFHYLDKCL